jgi:hypothetical protein
VRTLHVTYESLGRFAAGFPLGDEDEVAARDLFVYLDPNCAPFECDTSGLQGWIDSMHPVASGWVYQPAPPRRHALNTKGAEEGWNLRMPEARLALEVVLQGGPTLTRLWGGHALLLSPAVLETEIE